MKNAQIIVLKDTLKFTSSESNRIEGNGSFVQFSISPAFTSAAERWQIVWSGHARYQDEHFIDTLQEAKDFATNKYKELLQDRLKEMADIIGTVILK